MMNRSLECLLAIFVIASSVSGEENYQVKGDPIDLETMIWLEREGFGDPNVPTSTVHNILEQALHHEDSDIFNCAIGTMGVAIGAARELRIKGKSAGINRRLNEIPKIYDILVGLWEDKGKVSGHVVPDRVSPPANIEEVFLNKTGCWSVPGNPDHLWTLVPLILAYLFPGDDKVYDIVWKFCPQIGPGSLLMGLYEGKFNNPQDQQFRIDILRDVETGRHWSSLAARSLGDFRSAQGLETLVDVLEADEMIYGTPKFVIVEAMMKYEEDAVPHIPLIRETLDNVLPIGREQETLKITLQERFIHFERELGKHANDTQP